ncbi:MAG: hypothetical protein SF069_07635 [Phycisphaerae bacterium]|nr:hypothetical protein [Phycisphaerae bacterium]
MSADRRNRLTCATLDSAVLSKLQAVLSAPPWYRTRWTHPRFREGAHELLRSEIPEGFLIDATHGRLNAPPPFVEPFEPIELGENDPQLKTLSGAAKTSEEKSQTIALWILSIAGAAIFSAIVFSAFAAGRGRFAGFVLMAAIMGVAITVGLVMTIMSFRPEWYLVPGGVAIVRAAGGKKPAVTIFSRQDSIVVFRYVSTGKSTFLMCEMWSKSASESRAVSQREAISLMAAWQSPRLPPTAEELRELASPT